MDHASGSEEYIFGDIRILRASSGPCPVCGHPTGDCAGGQPPRSIVGVGIFPSLPHEEMVVVEEDIFEERHITPFSKGRFRVARKGDSIPMSRAKELGIC